MTQLFSEELRLAEERRLKNMAEDKEYLERSKAFAALEFEDLVKKVADLTEQVQRLTRIVSEINSRTQGSIMIGAKL